MGAWVKIAWLPRYGRDAASSRIRVYAVHEAMVKWCSSGIGFDESADVLMVQKAVDPGIFILAEAFHGRVVYDFDDLMDPSVMRRAHEVADLFTTDTEGRRRDTWKRCEVIPDCIDYDPSAPWPASRGEGAAWFGNYPNFESARWMVETLIRLGVQVRLISDLAPEHVQLPVEIVRWTYGDFVQELRKANVAILSHASSDPDKSNNKMTAAITFGVPCIIHDSRAYSELAHACGLDWVDVSGPAQLIEAFWRLQDPVERQKYLVAAQSLIWDQYCARSIARRLLKVLEE
jgi:hypothetical protein